MHCGHIIRVEVELGGHCLWSAFPPHGFRSHVPSLSCGLRKRKETLLLKLFRSFCTKLTLGVASIGKYRAITFCLRTTWKSSTNVGMGQRLQGPPLLLSVRSLLLRRWLWVEIRCWACTDTSSISKDMETWVWTNFADPTLSNECPFTAPAACTKCCCANSAFQKEGAEEQHLLHRCLNMCSAMSLNLLSISCTLSYILPMYQSDICIKAIGRNKAGSFSFLSSSEG